MATNEVVPGPTSRRVIENVKRLRAEKRLSFAQLADQLAAVGRPIRATGLHRLENGKRRVDVDDLIGLAAAFDVSPITLLLPYTARGTVELTEAIQSEALVAWDWLRAIRPLTLPDDREEAAILSLDFQRRSIPMGARGLKMQGTEFFSRTEPRPEEPPLNWEEHDTRRRKDES